MMSMGEWTRRDRAGRTGGGPARSTGVLHDRSTADLRQGATGTNPAIAGLNARLFRVALLAMNSPDQDTILRAVEDARRILGEYIQTWPDDATRTVQRLLMVLDRNDVVLALDRMNRRRAIRLVDLTAHPTREDPPA
jgi:hypothetical protein